MNYQTNIPSLHTTIPTLPPILGPVDLNRDILANTPIAPVDLQHADGVSVYLKGMAGSCYSGCLNLELIML